MNLTPEQEVWLRAWCATASAPDCKKPNLATTWADECLYTFQQRFPDQPKRDTKNPLEKTIRDVVQTTITELWNAPIPTLTAKPFENNPTPA